MEYSGAMLALVPLALLALELFWPVRSAFEASCSLLFVIRIFCHDQFNIEVQPNWDLYLMIWWRQMAELSFLDIHGTHLPFLPSPYFLGSSGAPWGMKKEFLSLFFSVTVIEIGMASFCPATTSPSSIHVILSCKPLVQYSLSNSYSNSLKTYLNT